MGEIVNKQRLQAILGRDHKTILKWQKEGMPVEETRTRGQSTDYDTEKVIDWLIKRASNTDAELELARIRLTSAQAEKTELEVETLKGSLIPIEHMQTTWSNILATFRARIIAMPNRLTPQIAALRDPKKIEKLLTDTCHEALNELAQYDPHSHSARKRGDKESNKYSCRSIAP